MPASLLVTGGARSGKSRFAQQWCEARPGERVYLATAQIFPDDSEMAGRIARHRAERGPAWTRTIEEPFDPVAALQTAATNGARVALVDCATLWISNLGHHHDWDETAVLTAVDSLAALLADPPLDVAVVTNEVGDGIVPDNALARHFRDLQGWTNQRLAAGAQNAALIVCGLPVWLKTGAGCGVRGAGLGSPASGEGQRMGAG
jgi:adenosylcobinamide kinase/adenosylcobinamide-phosphate guanylyltransferase